MRSWPVSTRLSSRSTSRSALHWTLVRRTEQQRAQRPSAASLCTKQQSTTQRGTVQISTKHYSSGQTAQSTENKKQLSTARQGVEQCITAQQWVLFSETSTESSITAKHQAAQVHPSHSCFKNTFISVLSSCWLETCMFLSSSRSSRPWNSSRNLQRRSVVWSSSSRTSRRRSRRGFGESSMFPAWASGARSAPERVRARNRHHRHLFTIGGRITHFDCLRQKQAWGPRNLNPQPFQSFFLMHYLRVGPKQNMHVTAG